MKSLLIIFLVLSIGGCSYETPKEKSVDEEGEKVFAVQMQVVGSRIEGLTVCFDQNNTCKKTDKNGMVEFDHFGTYSFKVRDIFISKLKIDANRTIVSPYTLFDKNETLAQQAILLLHAFDKTDKLDDEEVLLSLSSYIPNEKSFESLFNKIGEKIDSNVTDSNVTEPRFLEYKTNDFNITDSKEHNITIDFVEGNITRDDKITHVTVPKKESYKNLKIVMDFVDLVVDKNVTLDNFEEPYLISKNSLTSFNVGDKYIVNSIVKEDHIVIEFFDNSSRIRDEAILIINDEKNVLSTNLLNIRFDETEVSSE